MMPTAKRLPRFRRDKAAIRPIELTPRDKEILRVVARFRLIRSSQLMPLVSGSPAQILRRLQALYHHGWLDRPRCQIDLYHRGGSQPIAYGLGSKGAALMRREFDIPFGRMSWSRDGESVGRVFLEHTLMVADIVIAVEMACRQSSGVVRFVPGDELIATEAKGDPFHWHANVNGHRTGLVPDAVFALEFPSAPETSRRIICAVEADRGTMPVNRSNPQLSSMARKLSAYASLWRSGHFEKRFGTKRAAVVLVTTSRERSNNIAEAVTELPFGQGLFVTHHQEEICPDASPIIGHCTPRDKAAEI